MPAGLQEWLEQNTKDATSVRLRVGEKSNPSTVCCVIVADAIDDSKFTNYDPIHVDSWEECLDTILQALEGAGWGVEPGQECARLHVYGATGHQQKTWSRVRNTGSAGTTADPATQMAQEVIRMGAEIRRSFGVVCQALADQTQGREEAVMEMIHAHRAQVESQAHAELVQVLAEAEADVDVDVDPLRTAAAGIVEGLAHQFLPGPNGGGAPNGMNPKDLVMKALQSDPELVKELVGDPSVVELFMAATEPDPAELLVGSPSEVPPEPLPPSPMPE